MFCCTLLYVHSSYAIILMGKREVVTLLGLSSWCLVIVLPHGARGFVCGYGLWFSCTYSYTIFFYLKQLQFLTQLKLDNNMLDVIKQRVLIVVCFVVRYFMSILVLQSS